MISGFNKTAICAAMLTLGSTTVCAEADEPSRPFFAQMVLQGVTFQAESPNEGSINLVTMRAETPEGKLGPIEVEADGTITNVEVEDLNADGYPEIYVYVNSAGSGSYGSLIAYASNRNRSLSEIYLPSLEDGPDASKGYMGHDTFAVGEGALLRRFPVYREGDTNAEPSGRATRTPSRAAARARCSTGWKPARRAGGWCLTTWSISSGSGRKESGRKQLKNSAFGR
jgi:hypothetical protein